MHYAVGGKLSIYKDGMAELDSFGSGIPVLSISYGHFHIQDQNLITVANEVSFSQLFRPSEKLKRMELCHATFQQYRI